MSDFRVTVTVTVKNARMLRAMDAAGFDTAVALSRACGVAQTFVGAYLGLKLAPLKEDGEWRASILKIAEALRTLPEDLFPPAFLNAALKTNRVEREVPEDQIPALLGHGQSIAYDPGHALAVKDAVADLYKILRKLSPRQQTVLALRYGLAGNQPHTLEAVAERMGVSKERVRQMEQKAERLLRHPSRTKQLEASRALLEQGT
jgi:DNA-directed RNA polymerase specialized sigma24 family protein